MGRHKKIFPPVKPISTEEMQRREEVKKRNAEYQRKRKARLAANEERRTRTEKAFVDSLTEEQRMTLSAILYIRPVDLIEELHSISEILSSLEK